MTVAELIEELEQFPKDMDVNMCTWEYGKGRVTIGSPTTVEGDSPDHVYMTEVNVITVIK